MTDFPNSAVVQATPRVIHSGGMACPASDSLVATTITMGGTGTWPSANLAIFIPFMSETRFTVARFSIENGGTVAGNVDVGVYSEQGTLLVSKGSTAQSGTSTIQTFDVTDTPLGPGSYYLALVMSSTTATICRGNQAALQLASMGVRQMATTLPLPSTATFATMAQAFYPSVALHMTDTV